MRDYKHVTVPRKYRTGSGRTTVRRTSRGPARASQKRGSALKAWLGAFLSIVLTAALCYGGWAGYRWLTHAALFRIAGVDVKGVRSVSDADIRGLAAQFTGQNIFQADLGAATHRALANPWVKDVRIERRFPDRIGIEITERVPRAVLQAANGRFLADGEGVVIVPVPRGADPELPVIAIRGCRGKPGEAPSAEALTEALVWTAQLQRRGGWDLARVTIKADRPDTTTILYGGHEFRVGSGNYDEKLRRLGEIVTDLQQRGLQYTYVELRPERQAAALVVNHGRSPGSGGRARSARS